MKSVLLLLLALGVGPVAAQHPLNLGFETPGIAGPDQPWGWVRTSRSSGGAVGMRADAARSGRFGLAISREAPNGITEVRYWIPPRFAWGTDVELRGWVGVTGQAEITIQAWSDTIRSTVFEVDPGPSDWSRFSARVAVDSTAHSVVITVALRDSGHARFDDFEIRTPGRQWAQVPAAAAPDSRIVEWLRHRTTPLRTTSPDSSRTFEDLEALRDIIGDASLVALGETTHGTREFFTAKHRILAYLVDELGFRTFLIEANQLVTERINAYVHGGPGTAAGVIRNMFGVWNTEGMRALVDWMRVRNARHPGDPVAFLGFDMQDPTHPIDSVVAFLDRRGDALHPMAVDAYRDYRRAWEEAQYPWAADSVRAQWVQGTQHVHARITEKSAEWYGTAQSAQDSMTIDWVIQNANVAHQAALSAFTMELRTRDSSMAENIRWILNRRPGARAVIWAHDAHISKATAPAANYYLGTTMGSYLRAHFSTDYRPIGLLTFSGDYTGWLRGTPTTVPLFTAPTGSLESALHTIGGSGSILLTDLRDATRDPDAVWLRDPRLIRLIGFAAEDWGFATPISVGHQYDATVFIDHTTPSRLLPRRP